jgi:mono/diheme cytochrome c family protein
MDAGNVPVGPAVGGRWRPVLAGTVGGALLAVLLGVLVILPGAATHKQAGGLEQQYGDLVVRLATSFRGEAAFSTTNGDDKATVGRVAYMRSCAECHGAAGRGGGVFGATTFPPATDLTSSLVRQKSDGQLEAIVKNGLGFTGMPGYADQYNDSDIAAIVSYVRSLQQPAA